MLGIKPFVQESVQTLPPAQLRLLAETLRIDLRGCEDRGDIERVLTSLVCLDQDTSLGVFLAWLRSTSQQKNGILSSKKPQFNHTFLPAISSDNQTKPERVKDHHLDDEIKQKLSELDLLEASFKKAERLVHTGSPSFEKLKQFLLELTILRAKEQTTRAFLVRQVTVLKQQHGEMRAEMLHSRAQLDFFVDGFSNLRKRHDALLADATKMKAENETAQEIFISMSAHDCHFEQLMRSTLFKQLEDNEEMKKKLQQSREELDEAAKKRKQLEEHISQLKSERGDARKDAYCYKRQLRVCKKRMEKLQTNDGSFFRDQTVMLRQTVATLLGLLRDAVVRDIKSPKQNLSKETLRILQQVLTPKVSGSEGLRGNQETESEEVESTQPRVIHRQTVLDIDEVIKGVLLVGGATPTDAAECAQIMGEKLKYLPIDLKQTLAKLQVEENRVREEELRILQQSQSEGQGTDGKSDTSTVLSSTSVEDRPPPTLETYGGSLTKHVLGQMTALGKRGFVMYNWPFSSHDVNLLTVLGLSIDSVINLEIVGTPASTIAAPPTSVTPAAPPTSPKPKTPATSKAAPPSSRGKSPPVTSITKGKTSPTKPTTASKSPVKSTTRTASKPTSKPRTSSPSKVPTSPSKSKTPAPVTPASSTSQLKIKTSEVPKIVKKIPTAVSALQGLGGIVHSVGPAAFPTERVNTILQVLEQQKRQKLAPVVRWDEDTRRRNELLAMWAEEVHMLVHIEQESRKPKKVEVPAPAATPTKSTRAVSPSKITAKTPSTAQKTKITSSTRSSPTKAKATATTASKTRSTKK
ncbi:hypothetical protein P3T76_011638 [Phytophthora citrophthora]|uniref:Uncharacterized protein n=1 Tax=Phytophthora citrophthora TaxID=4793 RepID=A0AAD9LEQ6_9STRA|nr:hypothetical protein P3T76_011638 [Phytophthora citrophthora]